MGDFKKLEVWQKSQRFVATIYRLTSRFPTVERYGLSAQMRKAAISVPANIAEGCGRMGDVELRRFLRISLGSLSELECEVLLAGDLQLIASDASDATLHEIGSIRGMLMRLHSKLDPRP